MPAQIMDELDNATNVGVGITVIVVEVELIHPSGEAPVIVYNSVAGGVATTLAEVVVFK
jgi:hypothetical protein